MRVVIVSLLVAVCTVGCGDTADDADMGRMCQAVASGPGASPDWWYYCGDWEWQHELGEGNYCAEMEPEEWDEICMHDGLCTNRGCLEHMYPCHEAQDSGVFGECWARWPTKIECHCPCWLWV
jgi:hypothetical protein